MVGTLSFWPGSMKCWCCISRLYRAWNSLCAGTCQWTKTICISKKSAEAFSFLLFLLLLFSCSFSFFFSSAISICCADNFRFSSQQSDALCICQENRTISGNPEGLAAMSMASLQPKIVTNFVMCSPHFVCIWTPYFSDKSAQITLSVLNFFIFF